MTDLEKQENINSELVNLLIEAKNFMNLVPDKKYGNNYELCSKISKYLKSLYDKE